MDPVEALKHIRALLQLAADIGNIDTIEKHLSEAQEIIDKALPLKKPAGVTEH